MGMIFHINFWKFLGRMLKVTWAMPEKHIINYFWPYMLFFITEFSIVLFFAVNMQFFLI